MSDTGRRIYAEEPLAKAIQPYFDTDNGEGNALGVPFSELPQDLRKRVADAFSPLLWDEMGAGQRIRFAQQFDTNEPRSDEGEDELRKFLMLQRTGIGSYQRHTSVTPEDAAKLCCGIHPDRGTNPEECKTGFIHPADYRTLLKCFQSEPSERRTLSDWMKIAVSKQCKTHPWVRNYLLSETVDSPVPAENEQAQVLPAPQPEVSECLKSEGVDASAPTQNTQEQAGLAPAQGAAAPVAVESTSTAPPAWQVFKPKRFNGYTAPLFHLLNKAFIANETRPTARDVLDVWRTAKPAEIAKVLSDGIDYYDARGDDKPADLEAIRKAIDRMTSARQAPRKTA